MMDNLHRKALLQFGLFGLVLIGAAVGVGTWVFLRTQNGTRLSAHETPPHDAANNNHDDGGITVKAIRPKRDPGFSIAAEGLATVEAFFQEDLRAREAGVVKYVAKDLGDPVSRGEVLVEIDVPHLDQEVLEKESVVKQRIMDRNLARAKAADARALLGVAKLTIAQKELEVEEAELIRDRRKQIYERIRSAGNENVADKSMVEEEYKNWRASEVAIKSAKLAVERARADYQEKESNLEAALADVELKEAQIEVAQKDRDRTLAQRAYSRIMASNDGVVIKRNVDVGAFVQNAATANTEPMMSIARTDIVTIVGNAPEKAAPFITRETEVSILLDELPGVSIRGKVTRFSPSIQTKDRNMKVEVDLFNGTQQEYARFLAIENADVVAPLAANQVFSTLTLMAASRNVVGKQHKGWADRLPLFPQMIGASPGKVRMIPGMSGRMRFSLQKFQDSYLLPRSAVFSPGGKDYIMEVRDGVTHLVPVRVQINDGKLVKVAVIVRETGGLENLRELTGDEVILLNRQAEVGAGQPVTVTIEKW